MSGRSLPRNPFGIERLAKAKGMADFPNLLTMREVAVLLRCSKAQVCRLISGAAGCLPIPAIPLGRRKLIRKEALLAWIEASEHFAVGNGTISTSQERGAGKRA